MGRIPASPRALLSVCALCALLLGVSIYGVAFRPTDATAHTPHAGLDFSMAIDVNGDSIDDCSTSGGSATCYVTPGSGFTLKVYLNSLPNGVSSYQAFNIRILYSGVTSKNNPSCAPWPDLGGLLSHAVSGNMLWSCDVPFFHLPSTYTGFITTLGLNCTGGTSSGNTVTMLHGELDTGLDDGVTKSLEALHAEGNQTTETLTVNCLTSTLGNTDCFGMSPTITGTGGGDTINGTSGADVIQGLGGNDIINGLGGADRICGGGGGDSLDGGFDNDFIDGGPGADTLYGGPGTDKCTTDDDDIVIESCEDINTPTTKPATGLLSGVYDIWVPGGLYPNVDKSVGVFLCIASLQHDAATNRIKASAQCVVDTDTGDPRSALSGINVPGEGPDCAVLLTPLCLSNPGPPPPPPYNRGKPFRGEGQYNPGTDHGNATICLANVEGGLGPNVIFLIDVNRAVAQLQTTGKAQGALLIYGNQSDKQCRDLTPAGPTYQSATFNIKLQPIDPNDPKCNPGQCTPVAWRTPGDTDYDNDGCTDEQELAKPAPASGCGDDPWNPYDSNATDLSGSWHFLATARPADACFDGSWDGQGNVPQLYNCVGQRDRTFVPGAYYHCYSYVEQHGTDLTAPILCYTDWGPNTSTHPFAGVAPGPGTPLSVNPEQCQSQLAPTPPPGSKSLYCTGDGSLGAAPPGKTGWGSPAPDGISLFADIETRHSVLTGTVAGDSIELTGCWLNLDSRAPLGWVYLDVSLNRYTWQGSMSMWWFQDPGDPTVGANCQANNPTGVPVSIPVEAVRESTNPLRDTDQDGCPDRNELSNTVASGGLRDPANPWDYFNPANNSGNTTADITAVVQHYGHLPPDQAYNTKYDRGGSIPGSNAWNLRPPNNNINTGDITAAVNSYGHDCGTGINKTPTPPAPTRTPWIKSPPPPTNTHTP